MLCIVRLRTPSPQRPPDRPDGYVAWASPDNGSADSAGLSDALTDWFGPQVASVGA
ncbi:hypothetical protein AB0L00_17675 [Actinoallomurus sp. NPDC052308]|uniref:aromatic-ring hydroxylase C-terminal domain-containing protein n=1 Tax=Actinoallomurus TaxID=667113 RepID=UPI003442B7E1